MSYGFHTHQADSLLKMAGKPSHWFMCGIHASHHALLLLGHVVDKNDMLKLPTWQEKYGVHKYTEMGLECERVIEILRHFGGTATNISSRNRHVLKRAIDRHLNNGHAVILGVAQDTHWAALGGIPASDEYVWIDSADPQLTGSMSWSELESWIDSDEGDTPVDLVEAIAVSMSGARAASRSMVPHLNIICDALSDDRNMANYWGDYLQDADRLFDYPLARDTIEAKVFLETNEQAILQSLRILEDYDEELLRYIYTNLKTVADYHSLSLPRKYEREAIASTALLLNLRRDYYPA